MATRFRYRSFDVSRALAGILVLLPLWASLGAADAEPVRHPANGTLFQPRDVDLSRPVYQTDFNDPGELRNWVLEGGKAARIEEGVLVLESERAMVPGATRDRHELFYRSNRDHLVYWLKQEIPENFFLELVLRPEDRNSGLNIVFFSYRGVHAESIFDPALAPRDGTFKQYHSSDLKGYHVSYWAAPRGTVHIRKNPGFHLVAVSDSKSIAESPLAFNVLTIYKRGGKIRVALNDRVIVAWDDDGGSFGPVISQPGWIGLRQMGYTLRTEYDRLAIYPLLD
jgi:hypothetical protein